MAFFEFPHTRTYDSDLGWLIKHFADLTASVEDISTWKATHAKEYAELYNMVDGLIHNLVDVIVPWDSSIAYHIFSIVEYQGTNYIAVKDVPVGVMITNTEYWQPASTIVEQINAMSLVVSDLDGHVQKNFINMKDAGIVPNTGEDVTDAIQAVIDDAGANSIFYFPAGEYLIREVSVNSTYDDTMEVLVTKLLGIKLENDGCTICGDGQATILKGIDPVGSLAGCIVNITGKNCSLHDVQIYGNYGVHQTVTLPTQGNGKDEWLWGVSVRYPAQRIRIYNCHFQNCFADGLNIYNPGTNGPAIVFVDKCTFDTCGRNAIQIGKGRQMFVSNCRMYNITGEQTTGCALDIESHDAVTKDVFVVNCSWEQTVQGCAFNSVENGIVSNCHGAGSYSALQTIQRSNTTHPLTKGVLVHGCAFDGVVRAGSYTTIEGCIGSNINAEPADGALTKCVIKNNTCTRINAASTACVSDDHVKIVYNTVDVISANATLDGVDIIGNTVNTDIFFITTLVNCLIKDNSIVTDDIYTDMGAIHIAGTNSENITIDNNYIEYLAEGSALHQNIRAEATGLIVNKNTCIQKGTGQLCCRLRGNTIRVLNNIMISNHTILASILASDGKGSAINNTLVTSNATPANAISDANVVAGNNGAAY